MELVPYGTRVNSLSPGYMMTDKMCSLQIKEPKLVEQFEKETLFGRIRFPDELRARYFSCVRRRAGGIWDRIFRLMVVLALGSIRLHSPREIVRLLLFLCC